MRKGIVLVSVAISLVFSSSATEISSVFVSLDEKGQRQKDMSAYLPEEGFIANVFSTGQEVFIGYDQGNLYESRNLESSIWNHITFAGFRNQRLISAVYKGYSTSYVAIRETGIFRRVSDGGWESIQNSLSEKNIHAMCETSDGCFLAAGSTGIYKTHDQGKTWVRTLQEGWVFDLVDFSDVLVASGDNGIYTSVDQGEHWKLVYQTQQTQYSFRIFNDTFFALKDFGTAMNKTYPCLLTSNDHGKTWTEIKPEGVDVKEIFDAEIVGSYLFFSTQKGIYRSEFPGHTWDLILESKSEKQPMRFELLFSGEKLYALKIWNGC